MNLYLYDGPVMEFDNCVANRWTASTRAVSEKKARSNLTYQFKKKNNRLRIEVRNLDANRMIWMDRNDVKWQTFFLVDVAYRNFSAKLWDSVPSGVLGPIDLRCCKHGQ